LDLGYFLLIASLFLSLFSSYSFFKSATIKGKEAKKHAIKGERALYIYTFLIIMSYILLTYYFLVRDFNVFYVYSYSDVHLSLAYTISAVWAGREGSLLLWALFVSILSVIFVKVEKKDVVTALTLSISSSVVAFFLLVMLTLSNPFYRWEYNPSDGYGLNPLLRTPEMALHPPTMFLGYAGATLPFALAVSSFYLKVEGWHLRARLWALISWIFLTVGIFLGGWWAYKTLGWGGFWAWDPVENASFLPWLTVTGFLHGIMRNRKFNNLNYWLAYLSFALVVLATFITRSGVIESVHAFEQNPEGWMYLALIGIMAIISGYVYLRNKDVFQTESMDLKSRDFMIFLNIVILLLGMVTILAGTIAPTIMKNVTVDRSYYDTVETPLGIALTIILGVCISLGWKFKKDEVRRIMLFSLPAGLLMFAISYLLFQMFYVSLAISISTFSLLNHIQTFKKSDVRNPRKLGGYLVHLGVLLIVIGVAGSWMYDEVYKNIAVSIDGKQSLIDTEHFGRIALKLESLNRKDFHDRTEFVARIAIYQNGEFKGFVNPKTKFFNLIRKDRVVNGVDILSYPSMDYYTAMSGFSQNQVFIELHLIPLISLVWIGSGLVIAGGTVSAFLKKESAS